jgi:hypothetical protein
VPCAVWSEPGLADACATEFADTPRLLEITAAFLGRYDWRIYDLLVLPPAFPYGGMENPCLTFVTPTLLAGDGSALDVVAHEIIHSWMGNLCTNASWEHFWLNEGFTRFCENRTMQKSPLRVSSPGCFCRVRTLWDFVNHFFSLPPGAKLSTESLLNYTFDVHMDFGNVTMNMTVDNVESDTKEVIDAVTQHELNDISDIVTLEDPLRLGSNEIKYVVCDKRRPQCRTYGSNVTSVNNADALAAHNDTSGRRLWVWKHRRRRFSINTGRVVGWATCTAGAAAHTYAWPPSAAAYATPGGQVAFYACKEGVRHGYNEIDGHGDTRRRRWFR